VTRVGVDAEGIVDVDQVLGAVESTTVLISISECNARLQGAPRACLCSCAATGLTSCVHSAVLGAELPPDKIIAICLDAEPLLIELECPPASCILSRKHRQLQGLGVRD